MKDDKVLQNHTISRALMSCCFEIMTLSGIQHRLEHQR